ncbi:MAG: hypothetical protein G01um101418_595 [Parcubacteria group bacterium Gr01-1014_18]|nr:MAG: hypothetical protein Greene041636_114 [Parcubacteria group bacterium Greene0416_36]TSC80847.1 MAG: hypothetical protein G01um101418_595 [Parcubacteria group bacterium Gr01-1014_18]TSC99508.1 MAG: hypothetical protein Greene101420_175 [Parcubacteria group bacterium Greene1014_20]
MDKENKPSIPRAAIRMENGEIAEVRGIASEQNLDPYIGSVVDQKLGEFADGKGYQKKSEDMKRLTEIDRREKNGESLTKEDLKFLYEIESKIEGFGYEKDPRIEEILGYRDVRSDLVLSTGYSPEQISMTEEEALSGGIKFHYGDLNLGELESAEGLELPESVGGDLDLSELKSAEGLKLPESVGGGLYLYRLESAEGLELPKRVGGDLNLNGLESAEGLKLPESIRGFLDLGGLKSAKGLELPESVGGDLDLSELKSAEGLELPKRVGGDLNLRGLKSAEGLELPESVGGRLYLSGLKSAEREELQKKYPQLRIAA